MIDSDYKRTPKELVARYKFEPSIHDLYVEGMADKVLFLNYIRSRSLKYNVYPIETVETKSLFKDSQDIAGYKENVGNKEKIERLSAFFEEGIGARSQCVFCICDRDHDTFFGEKVTNSYLRKTDFAALESYVFEEKVLNKFLFGLLRDKAPSGTKAIADLSPVVQFLFLVRITRYTINNSWVPVDIDRVISFDKNGNSTFDLEEYLTKLTSNHKNVGVAKHRQDFIKQYSLFETNTSGIDYRYVMHGHDFGIAINLYLKKLGCEHVTSDFIERVLLLTVDAEDLDKYALFREIAQCVR